jgi:serine/threonine-protein kinase RsbW
VRTRLEKMGRSDNQPHIVAHIDDRSRFVRSRVVADARTAARIRAEFGRWLDRYFTLDAERIGDLLLALNEAMANAAEFAYIDASQLGTVDVSATYDVDSDTLAVTVDDRGRWHQNVSDPASAERRYRGRGISLMRVLADEATIDPTPHGTHVTLTWNRLTQPTPPPEQLLRDGSSGA